MTRVIKATLLAAAALATTTTLATAGDRVDHRQQAQADRIEHGRNTGAITWREGVKLRQEQARIARLEALYRADGKLDRWERQRLQDLQNAASRHIYAEGHDRWSRWSVLPRFGR